MTDAHWEFRDRSVFPPVSVGSVGRSVPSKHLFTQKPRSEGTSPLRVTHVGLHDVFGVT